MTSGQWIPGKSHGEVAAKFGVSPATVKDWATSASRVIRLSLEGDLQDIRARMLATLDTVVSRALRKKSPDLRAAVSAIDTQGKLLGIQMQKHDVTIGGTLMTLSRAEHLTELAKLKAEIELEERRAEEERLP